jgi:hypothetical protein
MRCMLLFYSNITVVPSFKMALLRHYYTLLASDNVFPFAYKRTIV